MERGAVQAIKEKQWNNKTFYSLKVNGEWYSTGVKRPPAEGTYVEFEYEINGRGYKDVKGTVNVAGGVSKSQPQGTERAVAGAKFISKDDYWVRREERDLAVQQVIQLQAARNAAIEVVKILVAPVVVDGKAEYIVKPPAQAKRKEWVEAMIDELTQKFVEANNPVKLNNPGKGDTVDEQIAAMEKDEPAVAGWE